MSPNIPSFINDLVEMAQATQRLPAMEVQVANLTRGLESAKDTLLARELSILELKAQIETLHAKVRAEQEAREDAELRFLEAEERTGKALDFIKTSFGTAGSLIQALEPPAPVVPVTEPVTEVLEVAEAAPVDPTTASSTAASEATASPNASVLNAPEEIATTQASTEPQTSPSPEVGAPFPTDAPRLAQPWATPSGAPSAGSGESSPSAGSTQAPDLPYVGKLYIRIPGYVNIHDWIEGGGTRESYEWRDGLPMPAGIYLS